MREALLPTQALSFTSSNLQKFLIEKQLSDRTLCPYTNSFLINTSKTFLKVDNETEHR
jgi:hypothetical protein